MNFFECMESIKTKLDDDTIEKIIIKGIDNSSQIPTNIIMNIQKVCGDWIFSSTDICYYDFASFSLFLDFEIKVVNKPKEMTLDEAIEHCLEKSYCDDTDCGKEHKQLAKWLQELRDYKLGKKDDIPF